MKRFLPSSVMLTPFVVKHYDQQDSEQLEDDHHKEPNDNDTNRERRIELKAQTLVYNPLIK